MNKEQAKLKLLDIYSKTKTVEGYASIVINDLETFKIKEVFISLGYFMKDYKNEEYENHEFDSTVEEILKNCISYVNGENIKNKVLSSFYDVVYSPKLVKILKNIGYKNDQDQNRLSFDLEACMEDIETYNSWEIGSMLCYYVVCTKDYKFIENWIWNSLKLELKNDKEKIDKLENLERNNSIAKIILDDLLELRINSTELKVEECSDRVRDILFRYLEFFMHCYDLFDENSELCHFFLDAVRECFEPELLYESICTYLSERLDIANYEDRKKALKYIKKSNKRLCDSERIIGKEILEENESRPCYISMFFEDAVAIKWITSIDYDTLNLTERMFDYSCCKAINDLGIPEEKLTVSKESLAKIKSKYSYELYKLFKTKFDSDKFITYINENKNNIRLDITGGKLCTDEKLDFLRLLSALNFDAKDLPVVLTIRDINTIINLMKHEKNLLKYLSLKDELSTFNKIKH